MSAFSLYNHRATETALRDQHQQQVDAVIERITRSLPTAIWNFNPSQVILIVESEVRAAAIHGIAVQDEFEVLLTAVVTDDEGEPSRTEDPEALVGVDPERLLELELMFGSDPVGFIQLATDETAIEQALAESLVRTVLQNLILLGLLVVGVYLLTRRLVIQPLAEVNAALQDISRGEGDLTHRLKVRRKDEIGELATNFNFFVQTIHQLVAQVIELVAQTGEAIQKTQATVDSAETGVRQQRQQIDGVAESMHQMNIAAENVAESSEVAAAETQNANDVARKVREIVGSAVAAMVNLADEIEVSAKAVGALEDEVNQITTVLDVIRGIAEQTNLLALNAAIEAARAGEHGRGFAVVADEVRSLASKTQSSTEEIHNMIEQLEHRAQDAVRAMEVGREKGVSTVEQANGADGLLDTISEAIEQISDKNSQIASSATEQSSVAHEIGQSLDEIAQIASDTDAQTRVMKEASDGLAALADELSKLVGNFKV
ncbi:MAG: methyl-accepting chemotaxis protein [Natronospirillum sp.]|uniref:methyl-accepting chemotaxis protein n=1 Tax=Natronospirillum sp. TaxID=2812955 RepID=UPI0025FD01FC|nr:methyl-accepting chemotaxis protein [Natronospirillum sp.]MCH8551152.1 methyl-accepting chemotaxis protein [Natronospirillum sp.]